MTNTSTGLDTTIRPFRVDFPDEMLEDLRRRVSEKDTHLLYVTRKSLRDQLNREENFKRLAATGLNDADVTRVWCPLRVRISAPVRASHTRAVPS